MVSQGPQEGGRGGEPDGFTRKAQGMTKPLGLHVARFFFLYKTARNRVLGLAITVQVAERKDLDRSP